MTNTETSPNQNMSKDPIRVSLLIAGLAVHTSRTAFISSPWPGHSGGVAAQAEQTHISAALEAAEGAREVLAATSRAERAGILERLAVLVEAEGDALSELLVDEVGKTTRDAAGEVARTVSTLRFAAAAARTLKGEILPLDAMLGAEGKFGYTLREPIGTVIGIPAANYPLLITAHKLGPAIGAGCPIIIKAPDLTPRVVVRLAELALEAGLLPSAVSVLIGGPDVVRALISDDRPRLVAFTGSSAVGRAIAGQAGFKRLLLELGSNAATIVAASADVEYAAQRIVAGAFAAAGQSCISVQRVYVHSSLRQQLEELIATRAALLRAGGDPGADVGPLLSEAAADRVAGMIEDARAQGGQVLCGGGRTANVIEPTVVSGLTPTMQLHAEEVFGPVVALAEFDTVEEAIALVNDSRYGLQAGIFTNSTREAQLAIRTLQVGAVHINEISMWRADHMPYGGVKDSGFGKEGPEWAMQEMTVLKVVSWADRS